MKGVLVLCFFALVSVTLARPNEQYTNKYDNVNLDEILGNRRLLIPYVKCTLDEGKCTPDGKELKSHIKEGLETDCAKCNPNQRSGGDRVIGHLINHEPEFWEKLKAKYDPDQKYAKLYETRLRAAKA